MACNIYPVATNRAFPNRDLSPVWQAKLMQRFTFEQLVWLSWYRK